MVLPRSTRTTKKTETWGEGNRQKRHEGNKALWEPMMTLFIFYSLQMFQKQPDAERRWDTAGWRGGRRGASKPRVCPSSVFNDPKHLTAVHLSSLLLTSHPSTPARPSIEDPTQPSGFKGNLWRNDALHSTMSLLISRRANCSRSKSTRLHALFSGRADVTAGELGRLRQMRTKSRMELRMCCWCCWCLYVVPRLSREFCFQPRNKWKTAKYEW